MTKTNPTYWMGKLLRLLHITRSNKTAAHHHEPPHHRLPVIVVPRTDLVDDPAQSDIPLDTIILPVASNLFAVDDPAPSDIPLDGIILPVASNLFAVDDPAQSNIPDGRGDCRNMQQGRRTNFREGRKVKIDLGLQRETRGLGSRPIRVGYSCHGLDSRQPNGIILPVASELLAVDNSPSDLNDLPYDVIIPTVVVVPRTDFLQIDDSPSDLPDLPRDIILDILSRLPAECIYKCQCVSRPLQVLTTVQFFTHLQRQRSSSIIVVQLSSEITKLCYMNKEFERIEEKFTTSSLASVDDQKFLLSSYDGFLTFIDVYCFPGTFYMWNPITGDQLTTKDKNMHVCGLYFNPVRNGYELMYYTVDDRAQSGQYCSFSALNLRSKLRRDVGMFPYPPTRRRPPVIIRGTLYWMIDRSHYTCLNKAFIPPFSDSIMAFNIEAEEFRTMEPGGRKYSATEDYSVGMLRICELHLSEIDGELCLCDFISFNELLLSIFNHATQRWSTREVLVIPVYPGLIYDWPNTLAAEVVQIKDNEVLVRQGRRLVIYNMLSNTCKTSEIMGCADKGIRVTVHTNRITSFHL